MSRWWRAYDEALNDPKLQGLGLELIGAWFNLLCMASMNEGMIRIADVPFALRLSKGKTAAIITKLATSGLLDRVDDDYRPHNWTGRQYVSDDSTERVQRYRERRKASGLPPLADYTKFKPALVKRDGELCVYCEAVGSLVVDHMVPIALGGTDHEDNLALACKPCNSGKAGRTPELAHLTIRVTTAATALARYRDNKSNVTVTETAPDYRTDSDNRTDSEKKEPRAPRAALWPFDEFWRQYPHKVGKQAAEKAFRKAEKKATTTLDNLMLGLMRYAAKTDDRPWCNPATWLNEGRWEDQPAPQLFNGSGAGHGQPSAGDRAREFAQLAREGEAQAGFGRPPDPFGGS